MSARWLFIALATYACGVSRAQKRADGSYLIECKSQQSCLERATRLCGESGYDIIGGRHDQKVFGVPGNQKVVGKEDLYVRCRSDAMVDVPDPSLGSWRLERLDASTTRAAPAPATTDRLCRPGETQRCVGATACRGRLVCNSDGSGYGPCDCGSQPPSQDPRQPNLDAGTVE